MTVNPEVNPTCLVNQDLRTLDAIANRNV